MQAGDWLRIARLTLAAVCDEILLSFQHHCEVAHSNTELPGSQQKITAVEGLMDL